MPNESYINIDCLKVTQPIGTFYIGAINSKALVHIAYSDVRRVEKRNVEEFLGIERPLSEGRVKELKEYVNTIDATFPSNIILSIGSEDAEFIESSKRLKIRNGKDVAKIIDGQHRIAGLEGYAQNNFELSVTIFIDMDLEDQAMVFATINLKQTKVSKSLAYDLYEYTKTRSPQKTCHNIVKLLNYKEESPFKFKLKILGVASGKQQESITQATFVETLLKYISNNPMQDRNIIKSRKRLERAKGSEINNLIFRNMFIDERDSDIARNIWEYFKAIEKKWPAAWSGSIKGNILNRTTGFRALMRLFKDIYNSFNIEGSVFKTDDYYKVIKRISYDDAHFTPENYKPGGSGESDLYRALKDQIFL